MERTDTPQIFGTKNNKKELFKITSMAGEGQSWNEFGGSKHLRPDIKSRMVPNRLDFNIGEELVKQARRSYGSVGGTTPT
jgi:hypothetical protein